MALDTTTEVSNKKIMDAILELTNNFNENTKSMSQISATLDDIKTQQNEMKRDFLAFKSNTQASINALESSQQKVVESQEFLNSEFEDIKKELESTKKRAEEAETKAVKLNAEVQTIHEDIQRERDRNNDLEQYGRRCMLELNNIPVREKEDLRKIITSLAKAVNYQEFNYDANVDIVHRLNSVLETPPIIILFRSRTARNEFYGIRKLLKDISLQDLNLNYKELNRKIFLNESLTIQNSILFRKVRQACKEKNYKYFWTANGTIMCRKTMQSSVIKIKKTQDIDVYIK